VPVSSHQLSHRLKITRQHSPFYLSFELIKISKDSARRNGFSGFGLSRLDDWRVRLAAGEVTGDARQYKHQHTQKDVSRK
jgi:hypothetical protein